MDSYEAKAATFDISVLARAIELAAAGDPAGALPLLERCDPNHPDAAAALAAIWIAQHRPDAAVAALARALTAEPDWPLHHWNLAAALHQLGDVRGCYHALQRFVATSTRPSGLLADPDQPARLDGAARMIAGIERTARLTGMLLGPAPAPAPAPAPDATPVAMGPADRAASRRPSRRRRPATS